MAYEKSVGELTFDAGSGQFYLMMEDKSYFQVGFGATFEVDVDGTWVESGLEIATGDEGDLVFKLKNTEYKGFLDGIKIRM